MTATQKTTDSKFCKMRQSNGKGEKAWSGLGWWKAAYLQAEWKLWKAQVSHVILSTDEGNQIGTVANSGEGKLRGISVCLLSKSLLQCGARPGPKQTDFCRCKQEESEGWRLSETLRSMKQSEMGVFTSLVESVDGQQSPPSYWQYALLLLVSHQPSPPKGCRSKIQTNSVTVAEIWLLFILKRRR